MHLPGAMRHSLLNPTDLRWRLEVMLVMPSCAPSGSHRRRFEELLMSMFHGVRSAILIQMLPSLSDYILDCRSTGMRSDDRAYNFTGRAESPRKRAYGCPHWALEIPLEAILGACYSRKFVPVSAFVCTRKRFNSL